ncbi:hypothetical protein Pdw03_3584 [Penicillium digitatum]|uniref:Uncharacterized protein n=1 Tax=Penicillium digitatum TaxID=36651 RepID=A0A7T7BI80_PENDI|nr:hypothetical protein Pdw03_3584 [Penicillium digitatum]
MPSCQLTSENLTNRSPAVPAIPSPLATVGANDKALQAELPGHRPSPHFACHAHADEYSRHLAPGDP